MRKLIYDILRLIRPRCYIVFTWPIFIKGVNYNASWGLFFTSCIPRRTWISRPHDLKKRCCHPRLTRHMLSWSAYISIVYNIAVFHQRFCIAGKEIRKHQKRLQPFPIREQFGELNFHQLLARAAKYAVWYAGKLRKTELMGYTVKIAKESEHALKAFKGKLWLYSEDFDKTICLLLSAWNIFGSLLSGSEHVMGKWKVVCGIQQA